MAVKVAPGANDATDLGSWGVGQLPRVDPVAVVGHRVGLRGLDDSILGKDGVLVGPELDLKESKEGEK